MKEDEKQRWWTDWVFAVGTVFGAAGLMPTRAVPVPNEYCSDVCCAHRRWLLVTTRIGEIKIGWRKRVIEIDWSKTAAKGLGVELFAGEDTTKGPSHIHAWGYDAAERILSVLGSQPPSHPPKVHTV